MNRVSSGECGIDGMKGRGGSKFSVTGNPGSRLALYFYGAWGTASCGSIRFLLRYVQAEQIETKPRNIRRWRRDIIGAFRESIVPLSRHYAAWMDCSCVAGIASPFMAQEQQDPLASSTMAAILWHILWRTAKGKPSRRSPSTASPNCNLLLGFNHNSLVGEDTVDLRRWRW